MRLSMHARRRALPAIFAAVSLLAACEERPDEPAPVAAEDRPNIVLVSIDSLRADHVGAYGYEPPTTPFIDRLADEGVVFEHAQSNAAWTLPAHAAMLTGLYDSATGIFRPQDRLDESFTTLPEVLSSEGYRTIGYYSGPFLHPSFGLNQGFDEYIDATSFGLADLSPRETHPSSHRDITNPILLEKITKRLETLGGAEPFMMLIHMWDVHYDLIAPKRYRRMFEGYDGTLSGHKFRHDPNYAAGCDPALADQVLALYDAEIRYTDDTLAQIFAGFESAGLLDNTVFVITSDHGDEFLDHGGKGHTHTLYQELLAVPLIFWHPSTLQPRRIAQTVSLVDLSPTLLAMAGIAAPEDTMGRSLVGTMAGAKTRETAVMSELKTGNAAPTMRAIVLGQDKMIVRGRDERRTFFDLRADPGEQQPLTGPESSRPAQLAGALSRLRKKAEAVRAKHAQAESEPIEERLKEQLREMGYLD